MKLTKTNNLMKHLFLLLANIDEEKNKNREKKNKHKLLKRWKNENLK